MYWNFLIKKTMTRIKSGEKSVCQIQSNNLFCAMLKKIQQDICRKKQTAKTVGVRNYVGDWKLIWDNKVRGTIYCNFTHKKKLLLFLFFSLVCFLTQATSVSMKSKRLHRSHSNNRRKLYYDPPFSVNTLISVSTFIAINTWNIKY